MPLAAGCVRFYRQDTDGHLEFSGATWDITAKSDTYLKTDSQTIDSRVQVAPDTEKTVTYMAHYTW